MKDVTAEFDDGSCQGVDGKEECLMRRTLTAHVDYIYTDKHKPRNWRSSVESHAYSDPYNNIINQRYKEIYK